MKRLTLLLATAQMAADNALDAALLEMLTNDMLPESRLVEKMHERLIDVLRVGASMHAAGRRVFAEECYKNLFSLVARCVACLCALLYN